LSQGNESAVANNARREIDTSATIRIATHRIAFLS
jgi:hypothetical protein